MPTLNHQSEIDAYYLADPAQPRAAAVMWPVLIERRIDSLFEAALRPDKTVKNELFQSSGPLGNYAAKVRLAYMLGWFGPEMHRDLIAIGKIRNRFAHAIEAKDFSDQAISTLLKGMTSYRFIPEMLKSAREKMQSDPAGGHGAMVLILEGMLEVDHQGFRFCVDQMIHALDQCRENMQRNLASLKGGWLVGSEVPSKDSSDK